MASLRVAYTVIAMVPFVCANGHYETVTREDPHPPPHHWQRVPRHRHTGARAGRDASPMTLSHGAMPCATRVQMDGLNSSASNAFSTVTAAVAPRVLLSHECHDLGSDVPICDSDSNHIDTDIAVSAYRRAEAERADIGHGTIVFDRFAPAAAVTTHDRILSGTDGIMDAPEWTEIWLDSIDLTPPTGMSTASTTQHKSRETAK